MEMPGQPEGSYLFRERGGAKGHYVLGILFESKAYHYLFSPDEEGKLSIKAGRKFLNLMQIVEYYSQKSDGLLCKLTQPCNVELFQIKPRSASKQNVLLDADIQMELRRRVTKSEAELKKLVKERRPPSLVMPIPGMMVSSCFYFIHDSMI